MNPTPRARDVQVTATSFAALFAVVGLALYGLPLYYDFMVREFGWSRTMVTSGNALSKLVVGPLFGFGAGWIVDRFGPRRLMIAGDSDGGRARSSASARCPPSGRSTCSTSSTRSATSAAARCRTRCCCRAGSTKSRGKAMGVAYLGIGVGGAVVPLLSAWLTSRFGWRLSLQLVGVLIVVIALSVRVLRSRRPPCGSDAGATDRPLPRQAGRREASQPSIRAVLATPAFYLLALGSICSIAAVGGTNQHLKLFLSLDRGYSQADAAQIISLVLGVSIAGRLLMGWLADRMPRKHVMLLIYLLVAGVDPAASRRRRRVRRCTAFAVVFGLGLGGEYLIIPLMAGELFGVEVLGRVMGIVLTADGVAEATAPMLVGYLRDQSGSVTRPDSSRSSERRSRARSRSRCCRRGRRPHANRRRQGHRLQSGTEFRHAEARHRGRRPRPGRRDAQRPRARGRQLSDRSRDPAAHRPRRATHRGHLAVPLQRRVLAPRPGHDVGHRRGRHGALGHPAARR